MKITTPQFYIEAKGKNAEEAHLAALTKLGNPEGLSGTLSDKRHFVEIPGSARDLRKHVSRLIKDREMEIRKKLGNEAWQAYAQKQLDLLRKVESKIVDKDIRPATVAKLLLKLEDARIDPEYGPVGCIDLTPQIRGKRKKKTFLFFGWEGKEDG